MHQSPVRMNRLPAQPALVVSLVLAMFLSATAAAQNVTRRITLDAGALRCVLEQHADGVRLDSLMDLRRHTQLAAKQAAPLFEVVMNDAGVDQHGMKGGDKLTLEADRGWRQVRLTSTKQPGGVKIRWSNPTQPQLKGVSVTAVVVPSPKTASLRWKLSVHNDSERWSVWEVAFPQLSVADLGAEEKFFYPRLSGTVKAAPRRHGFNWQHPMPGGSGCTLAYFAVYAPGKSGLYVGREDPKPVIKILSAHSEKDQPSLRLRFDEPAVSPMTAGNDFTLSGEGVWRLFDGDWFDAAVIYRHWVREHAPWYPKMGPDGREDIPLWMRQLPVWLHGGTHSEAQIRTMVNKAQAFARFMDVPVGLHWYVWWRGEFDNDYPHYFPPKKGFAQGVKDLQANNVYVMPYINSRIWDTHDQGMKDAHFTREARPYAEKDADGHVYLERYHSKEANGKPVKFAVMCPATDFWQNRIGEISLRLFNKYHVKGVYLDQLGGTAFAKPINSSFRRGRVAVKRPLGGPWPLCFDAEHGHALGGGDWQITGYRNMLRKIRARMPRDGILCGEHSPGWDAKGFAGALVPAWHGDNLVPAFPAVYGGALQTFGRSFTAWKTHQPMVRVKAGLEMVYGQQLGWWRPEVVDARPLARYLRRLIRLRYQEARYFYAGQMARPLKLNVPGYTTRRVRHGHALSVTTPAVVTGSWEQRKPHKLLLLFVNPTEKPVTTTLKADLRRYGFTGRAVRVRAIQPDQPPEKQTMRLRPIVQRRKMTFAATSVTALEVTPANVASTSR